jgi:hypothetical protein
MAPLKVIVTLIVLMLAALLGSESGWGSEPAGAGQIGGIDQFLRHVTDILHPRTTSGLRSLPNGFDPHLSSPYMDTCPFTRQSLDAIIRRLNQVTM